MLRICLLGKPHFELDGEPFEFSARPKVLPLLAYLLLHRNGSLQRDSAANALWPDSSEPEARTNLRRHLHYLQQALPAAPADRPWLFVTAAALRWNQACEYQLDIEQFEQSLRAGRLADAAALYRGDLLEGVDDESLEFERERYRAEYIGCLGSLIGEQRARRDFAGAIASARALLARDPWREDVLRQLMVARFESGDRAGALADYERFAAGLRADLDVEPMPETAAAYAAIVDDIAPAGAVAAVEATEPHARGHARDALLPFVGRETELAILRERWNRAANGAGGLVLIGGEAGIGKTRLTNELAAVCINEGGQMFGGATTFPESTPYQSLVAAMHSAARMAGSVDVQPIWLAALAPLLPELRTIVPSLPELPAVDPARERTRLFEACAAFVESIGSRRPVCMIVEDVHWAGAGTIASLEYLARRLRRGRVLLIATYREEEIARNQPLRELRRALEQDGAAEHLALQRLPYEAIVALLERNTDLEGPRARDVAQRLYQQSEGSPFFLSEIVYELTDRGALSVEHGRWRIGDVQERMPTAVIRALEQRVARLSDRARTVAETAAVIGRGFGVELVKETTGWPEGAVLDALDELIDRRLVAEHGGRTRFDYAFNHHLIQSAVYAGIDDAMRARRHRRVAQVMEQLYPDAADELAGELALHWDRGREPERAAARYVQAAKRAAALYANDETQQHIARALELTTRQELRFEALLLGEQTAGLQGDRAAQLRFLEMLQEVAEQLGDDDKICDVVSRRAALASVTSDREGEGELIEELKQRAARLGDTRWQAAALEAEARMLRSTADYDGARSAFERLMQLTQATGDQRAHWAAHLARADTFIYQSRLPEARAALDDLRASLDPQADQSALIRTLMAFARAALVQQDYAAMSEFAAAALEASTAIGDREGEALSLHTMANGMVYVFRVAQAREMYERAAQIYEQIGHRVGTASVLVDMGLFNTEIGLLDRGLELIARADEVATAIGFQWVSCVIEINRGYCLRLAGEYARSKTSAALALERARKLGSLQLEAAALGTLGVAERELGEFAAAIEHLKLGVELRRPSGATPRLGDNLCGLALAYLGAGELTRARAAADEMLELYVANPKLAPQPSEWLWSAVEVYRALSETEEAERLLRQAASVMQARADAVDDDVTRAAFLALPFNRAVAAATAHRAPTI